MSHSSMRRDSTTGVVVGYVHRGRQEHVTVELPDDSEESRREAAHFVQTLADNGQLDGPDASHEIVAEPNGTRRLRRLRSSKNR
jgi:hypothetical protein